MKRSPDRRRSIIGVGSRPKGPPGFGVAEIGMATIIVALCLIPVFGLYSREPDSTAMTEGSAYAEVLATRILEVTSARPWYELEKIEGSQNHEILKELFRNDKRDDWYITLKEYRRKLGVGRDHYRATLSVRRLADGLLAIETVVRWSPPGRERNPGTLSLFRLRSREDFGRRAVQELEL